MTDGFVGNAMGFHAILSRNLRRQSRKYGFEALPSLAQMSVGIPESRHRQGKPQLLINIAI